MRRQDLARSTLALVDDTADLVVDHLGRGIGDVLALGYRVAEENLLLVFGVAQRPELVAEPELGDHAPRQSRRAADVIRRAGRHAILAKDQLLGDAAAEQADHHRLYLDLRLAVLVALRQKHRHAERAAARNDRDLVQRLVRLGVEHAQRVAGLVVGGQLLLVLGHHHRAPLGAHHDLVLGLFELGHSDRALAAAGRHQRRLVDEIGEVGAGEAGRAARDHLRDRHPRRAAPCACGPSGSSRGRRRRGSARRPVDRTGRGAAAPGRARPGGSSRRSG